MSNLEETRTPVVWTPEDCYDVILAMQDWRHHPRFFTVHHPRMTVPQGRLYSHWSVGLSFVRGGRVDIMYRGERLESTLEGDHGYKLTYHGYAMGTVSHSWNHTSLCERQFASKDLRCSTKRVIDTALVAVPEAVSRLWSVVVMDRKLRMASSWQFTIIYQAGTKRKNEVTITPKRRPHVVLMRYNDVITVLCDSSEVNAKE